MLLPGRHQRYCRRLAMSESIIRAPIFAGGVPRSGLHLLRAVFGQHPDIASGPDAWIVSMLLARRNIGAQLGELLAQSFAVTPSLADAAFARAISDLLRGRLAREGKPHLLEKSALNILVFPELARLFPDAKFIHLVRDGRDVVASLRRAAWKDPATGEILPHCREPEAGVRYWAQLVQVGLAAETAPELRGRVMRLRYEDLVRGPRETIEDVCSFLGLPFADQCLRPHIADAAGLETAGLSRLNMPLDLVSIGRGRQDLSPRIYDEISAFAAPVFRVLGYL